MKSHVAARVRVATRGRIAADADLSDILDLLDALEEGYQGEEMEEMDPTQDRRTAVRRARGRDTDPNNYGAGSNEAPNSGYGVNPEILDRSPIDCTDPEQWNKEHGNGGLDQEEEYEPWKEVDEEERRRQALAGSTGSQSLDDRIRANADRKRRAEDKRRQTLDQMRAIIRDALSARDTEVPGHNQGVTQSSVLDPTAQPPDVRGADRMAHDAALNSRSRLHQNMRRIGTSAVAYCPSTVGSSSPEVGGGPSRSFAARYPWATRVKV